MALSGGTRGLCLKRLKRSSSAIATRRPSFSRQAALFQEMGWVTPRT